MKTFDGSNIKTFEELTAHLAQHPECRIEKLDFGLYLQGPEISKSFFEDASKSIEHFEWAKNNPEPPTPAMIEGSAFHTAILERDEFEKRYTIAPLVDRRTKDGKEKYAQWLLQNDNKIVLSLDQYEMVLRMADKVRAHPLLKEALPLGTPEVTYYWTDDLTGLRCRCRVDWELPEINAIIDFKSIVEATYSSCRRELAGRGYYKQAAFYLYGTGKITNNLFRDFIFSFVEKKAPHGIRNLNLDGPSLEKGREDFRNCLNKFKADLLNPWKSYPIDIETVGLPSWKFYE